MAKEQSRDLTIKQQKFAHAFIETGNAAEAYRRSYDCSNSAEKTILRRGQELSQNSVVKAYIDEQRSIIAKDNNVKVTDIIEELEQARELAININMPGAAISASMGKAKLLGFDKPKDSNSDESAEPVIIEFVVQDASKKN